MEMLPVTEHEAQLDHYAQRHGQDTAAALDEVLANYLEWEQQDYNETVEALLEAYEDVKAGRTQPANEFLDELRVKYGLPH
jgi:predicted nucleic acid-binding Zn ribbon protein